MREVPEQQPFMATSCCPAWSVMAKKLFPDFAPYISMAMTPMVLTARLLKKEHKNCKVVFIGPCAAKKLEASRRTIRSDVDFVLTFEEVMGMFEAKAIKFSEVAAGPELVEATADGRGFAVSGGVANAVEIARRCKEAGLSLIVDFHYSDFWADPAKQMSPKAWVTMDLTQKCSALCAFTTDALTQIAATGVDIWMVQVGNEINGGMAGEWSTNGRNQLMNAGSAAVRAILPDALVAVHFTNVSQSDAKKYIREVCEGDTPVDFDVMAYSYYSYWHGSLENLSELMADVRETFGKDVFIAETAYPFTTNNLDTHPNSVPNEWCDMKQDISRDGQAADFRETVETAVQAGALGVCYWEPAWIPVPGNNWEEQSKLWEQFGSGWASSYAGGYDPQDAGAWFGGCAWENQALFEVDGTPAWTLSLPNILRGE